ncbi:MAG: hypothetical protein WA373_12535 [Burkholderiales bacterium]
MFPIGRWIKPSILGPVHAPGNVPRLENAQRPMAVLASRIAPGLATLLVSLPFLDPIRSIPVFWRCSLE